MFANICYLASIFASRSSKSNFIAPLTFLEPYVKENGRSDNFTLSGHYAVSTRGYNNFVQIGYKSPMTSAIIQSNEPIKRKNFRFETHFSFDTFTKGGNGFGIWISSKLTPGSLYGRNTDYKGFGAIINTKGSPYIQYVDSNGKKGKTVYLKEPGASHSISIEHQHPTVSLYYRSSRSRSKELIWSGTSLINTSSVLGISGNTGASSSVLRIFSVIGHPMKELEATYQTGKGQKSSPLVMIVGICSILGLVYYLYTKQKKEIQGLN